FDKGFQAVNLRQWLVGVPLQITLLPVDFPYLLASDPGCFGHIIFHFGLWIIPLRTNFEYDDALIVNSIGQVNLRSELFRRPAPVDKLFNNRFPLIKFSFSK